MSCATACCTAQVTKPAPQWSAEALLADGSFGSLSLSDFKGKYLVLFFYPLDFTFVCPTEIVTFSDRIKEFEALNCAVVGASIDSKFCHLAWTQQARKLGGLGQLTYPLISDLKHEISKAYGCYIEEAGHSARGLYIIDPKGTVRHITVNDPPVGRNVDEVLRLVAGYQFADEHGEVCPAGWKPGAATINPKDKSKYFSQAHA